MSGLKMNGPVSVRCLVWFRQKTADEVRISDWSSDVCSSDLLELQKFTELRLDRRHGQHQVLDTYAPTPRSIKPRFVRRNHPRFHRHVRVDDCAVCNGLRSLMHVHELAHAMPRAMRSEERRVGKECGSTGGSRWSPYP